MSKILAAKPISTSLILEKFRKTQEQAKYAFPTEYGTDTPRMGYDKQRYQQENRSLNEKEKWQQYLTQ